MSTIPDDHPPAGREVEFWLDFGSNYSYLAAMRIEALATQRGVRIAYRPFLLGPIFASHGWASSPFVLHKQKGAYVWKDMQRQCAKFGIPWKKPTDFPRSALLPMRVAVAATGEPWVGRFVAEILRRNFAEDEDIDSAPVVARALEAIGQESPARWVAAAQDDAVKLALRRQGDEAQARGIFGAPMLCVGDEMFWGNDRLEDALEFAARQAMP